MTSLTFKQDNAVKPSPVLELDDRERASSANRVLSMLHSTASGFTVTGLGVFVMLHIVEEEVLVKFQE